MEESENAIEMISVWVGQGDFEDANHLSFFLEFAREIEFEVEANKQ